MTFDSQWEDHEDDLYGDSTLDEMQDYYPHVHIIDLYEGTEEWEALEEEAFIESRTSVRNKTRGLTQRDNDMTPPTKKGNRKASRRDDLDDYTSA